MPLWWVDRRQMAAGVLKSAKTIGRLRSSIRAATGLFGCFLEIVKTVDAPSR